ncbi:hypothetical protein RA178_06290 [Shewanella oncorhynchi]|uniref:Phage tail protein n=1 Tax=Shewanella oncorhynchi TaxID=2726434 RepID=A0AA50KH41_9GAMM|nr:hypothetical protein [Shewanella oncorhynchi]WMB74221.1 hypothetical protein RA178_06290 [Shewanella oncorhynchi]
MSGLNDITLSNYMDILINDTPITNIESFSGLSEETSIVEVKHFNVKSARKLPASSTVAAVELTTSFVTDESYQALLAARQAETLCDFKVIYYKDPAKVEKEVRSFKGYVTSYSEVGELDSQRQCNWSVAVDGGITYGEGAVLVSAKAK